jgi:hypothetical protein
VLQVHANAVFVFILLEKSMRKSRAANRGGF